MSKIQQYLFSSVLRAVLTIIGGLSLLALLAQGLSQTDLIVENRQTALTYLKVVALGAPQIIAILAPLAVFIATLNALNRAHRDSEIVVSHAAGMTKWQIISPVLRLATAIAIIHLIVNLFVQPLAQRELRETIYDARTDIVSSLIRPGAFSQPTDGLTIYSREVSGGKMRGLLISDTRTAEQPIDYIAREGRMVEVEGQPAMRLTTGQIQQVDANGQISLLDFDDYVFELSDFLSEDSDTIFKPSDRFLFELFFPDLGDFYQHRDQKKFKAEAHSRLSTPLLNYAMAILAVLAVIGGNFSRRGYQKRIVFASMGAVILMLVSLTIAPQAQDDSSLNIFQYLVPAGTAVFLLAIYLGGISPSILKQRSVHRAQLKASEASS